MKRLDDYRQYLFLSSELFCSINLDGKIREPAGPWLEKTGLSTRFLNASNIFKHIHTDDIGVLRNAMLRAFAPQTTGLRIKNHLGEAVWFEVTISKSYEEGVFIFRALDISGRIRKDIGNSEQTRSLLQELSSIKQRLELAIRAVKFGVWDWNIKTGRLIWDTYMYELFEINERDFTSDYEAFEKTLVEDDRRRVQQELNAAFQAGATEFETEFRVITASGKTKIIKAVASCFYDFEGNIDRLVGNNWDITAGRETELKLKEAHSEIDKFFSISLDPLCVAGADGYLRRVNNAFVEILGYSADELTSRPYLSFVHPDDHEKTINEHEKLKQGIPTIRFENRYITKDGSYRYFSWVVKPDPESGLFYAAVRDLTEQVKQQHEAMQSAQMTTLGEMASGVAHEINNPLAIVQGKVRQIDRAIQNENIEVDKIRSDIQKIVATTDRIVKIVKGLRSFSRDSSKDPFELTSLASVVSGVLDLNTERFKNHGIELRVRVDSDIVIQCRGGQISQVLMNLVNNAHDAVLSLNSEPSEKWVEIYIRRKAKSAFIEVTDSGRGIADDVVDKMMQPFFTTKGVGRGTGLGLSISKGIAEEHNGTLTYEVSSGFTRFILELPINQGIKESNRFRLDALGHI
ncbi:MAG: PAS domain-containing protein [Bdellovibrionaceae bacterium]|nr:PAS domain-containing protein [Pseudobdellovibrionaceae bacterium]